MEKKEKQILLTGVSGYIGGRLLPVLYEAGYSTRSLVRNPGHIPEEKRRMSEIVQGDLLDPDTLVEAFQDIDVAFYLVHSLGASDNFIEKEYACAYHFATAAQKAGVSRIIYLGGLGEEGDELSPHLLSRHHVGTILRQSEICTIEFRASIIIGSGSLSYEMVRALVGRLPVMITPRWVHSKAQPISVEDVLEYLLEAIHHPCSESRIVEIGGPDVVSYVDIMKAYSQLVGIKRFMIPVPFLTPRLSSLWLALVTPLYARVGEKLIASIKHDTLVSDTSAQDFTVKPRGLQEALQRAIINEDKEFAETRWSNALSTTASSKSWGGKRFGSRIIDSRTIHVQCAVEDAYRPIIQIGGENGWYYANWAWWCRGLIDQICGGVGLRRGRNRSDVVFPGEHLDFWRVEEVKENELLRLRAEMKVPGRAWLQFEVTKEDSEGTQIRQTAIFDPLGVFGLLYWYVLFPIHVLIFDGMLRAIGSRAMVHAKARGE